MGSIYNTLFQDIVPERTHYQRQMGPRTPREEENEQVDQHARGAAKNRGTPIVGREEVSLAALKKQRIDKVHRLWREDNIRRNQGKRTFGPHGEGTRPRVRRCLRTEPRGLAARYFSWPADMLQRPLSSRSISGELSEPPAGGTVWAGKKENTSSRSVSLGDTRLERFRRKQVELGEQRETT